MSREHVSEAEKSETEEQVKEAKKKRNKDKKNNSYGIPLVTRSDKGAGISGGLIPGTRGGIRGRFK